MAAILMTMFAWGSLNPRGLLIFMVLLCLAEVFVQLRWRTSVRCPYCGFDPLIYLRDRSLAAEIVKQTLQAKHMSSEYLLSAKNPFVTLANVPRARVSEEVPTLQQRNKSSVNLLSKQV